MRKYSPVRRLMGGIGAVGYMLVAVDLWGKPDKIDLVCATIACATMVIVGAYRAIFGEAMSV